MESYISLMINCINVDGTQGESLSTVITEEEYHAIYDYLMRDNPGYYPISSDKKELDMDEYTWHNLQTNPDDLPSAGTQIIVESKGIDEVTKKKSYFAYAYRPCDKTWLQKQRAWRKIEPFEEV